jgi:hypothetical protein
LNIRIFYSSVIHKYNREMIETIHIFDEFSQAVDELTTEQRHLKRMCLDTLLYDILKQKYSEKLKGFWDQYKVPRTSDSTLVFIERRIHPNLAFLLYNAAYFARGWNIVVICSDINYEYCKKICGHNASSVDIRPWFKGNPTPEVGKQEYNNIQKETTLYESLPGEYLLFLEVDCYVRKPIPEEWKKYDLVAAPYEWDTETVGGGFSYRKKSSMIEITKHYKDDVWAADAYIMNGIKTLGMKIPPFELGITYISESCIYEDPIGVHQWWTFFFPNQMEDAPDIFHSLLSLDID